MEDSSSYDRFHGFRIYFRNLLFHEHDFVEQRIKCRYSIHHFDRYCMFMARNQYPSGLRRRLHGLQKVANRAPSPIQPDPTTSARTNLLHQTRSRYPHGRRSAIRVHLHPALFHPQLDLGPPNLLHVRIPLFSDYHSSHHLQWNHYFTVLLSSGGWGL